MRQPNNQLIAWIGLLFILAICLFTGMRGIDFGIHWDEVPNQITPLRQAVEQKQLLPQRYNYPSLFFWIEAATLVPDFLQAGKNPTGARNFLLEIIDSKSFLLRVRAVFLFLSLLSLIWVYLLVFQLRKNPFEALLSAAFLGLSWEFQYHARWVAPDTILMQFGAATLMAVAFYWARPDQKRWLWIAAVLAGFGMGSKYQGGILLLLVLFAVVVKNISSGDPRKSEETSGLRVMRDFWDRCKAGLIKSKWKIFQLTAIFFVAFLLTTPGAVLDSEKFAQDIQYEMQHYATGHYLSTVEPGITHFLTNLEYLAGVFFSHEGVIAIPFFGLALIGVLAYLRDNRGLAIVLLVVPVAYLLFISFQHVMIVRNLMVLAPFLAILAGRGFFTILALFSQFKVRIVVCLILISALGYNLTWLLFSSQTILQQDKQVFLLEAYSEIINHPKTAYLLSPKVDRDFKNANLEILVNTTHDITDSFQQVMLYPREGKADLTMWEAKDPNLTITWFGPYEVNFNYYPTWIGRERIILMDADKARVTGVEFLVP